MATARRAMSRTNLRRLLKKHQVGHAEIATELDTDVRTVRRYLSGSLPIPRRFEYAVQWALHLKAQEAPTVTGASVSKGAGRVARGGLDARV
jgi:hypothetical protein